MTGVLTILSVLAAWALLGVLVVGLLLVLKSLQSIRHWFEKTTVGVRAVAHQTRDLDRRATALTVSLQETLDALGAAPQRLDDPDRQRS